MRSVVAAHFADEGQQVASLTVDVLCGLGEAVRTKLASEPLLLRDVAAFFHEEHGFSLWADNEASPACVVASNVVSELVKLSITCSRDASCSEVEPANLALAIAIDADLPVIVDMACDHAAPVVGRNARCSILQPGVKRPEELQLKTCTDTPHKCALSDEEMAMVMARMEEGKPGDECGVAGDRCDCCFIFMSREYDFSEAWDQFEQYLQLWHRINFLPRITVRHNGLVAKRVSMDSSRYGVCRPEPVADGGFFRILKNQSFSCVPISFCLDEVVFVNGTMSEGDEGYLAVFGNRITQEAPEGMNDITISEEMAERLLATPVTVRFRTEANPSAVFVDAELLRKCGGPVAMYNSYSANDQEELEARRLPKAVAFSLPLDPQVVLVISRNGVRAILKEELAEL